MAIITEDYVSFEIAKTLKEKGFNESCMMAYVDGKLFNRNGSNFPSYYELDNCGSEVVDAPTLQMARKWLRKIYKLYVEVYIIKSCTNKTIEYCITIEDLNFPGNYDGFHIRPSYKSYEQACEAAIKYCLENLI